MFTATSIQQFSLITFFPRVTPSISARLVSTLEQAEVTILPHIILHKDIECHSYCAFGSLSPASPLCATPPVEGEGGEAEN